MERVTSNPARVMIAGVSSGCGKTLLTCGLLRTLQRRELKPASFKCGPDYIDPMFHSEVIGVGSGNLDSFFTDQDTLCYLMDKHTKESDLAVIEGVMGYYDGLGGISTQGSSFHIAEITNTPVILVINCKGMSLSVLSIIKGFLTYQPESMIKGVILNRVSQMIYKELKIKIEEEFSVKVVGYLPDVADFGIESRHLGLITPNEIEDLQGKLDRLSEQMEETVCIDEIIRIAKEVTAVEYKEPIIEKWAEEDRKIKIAVAKDSAFCFYYRDNLELLEEMGAELTFFSPITDKELPKDCEGLLLGGGYPELYLKELSVNGTMREAIKKALESGLPCIAECGGFLYLNEYIEDREKNRFRTVGFIHGEGFRTDKLGRFGYITLTGNKDNIFCKKNDTIKGHEFHYWDCTDNGTDFTAKKPIRNRVWDCVHTGNNFYAGFPHLYFYSNIEFARNFLKACRERRS